MNTNQEILPHILLTPPFLCSSAMSRAKNKVNKRSTLKEDESALLVYLLFSVLCMQGCVVWRDPVPRVPALLPQRPQLSLLQYMCLCWSISPY